MDQRVPVRLWHRGLQTLLLRNYLRWQLRPGLEPRSKSHTAPQKIGRGSMWSHDLQRVGWKKRRGDGTAQDTSVEAPDFLTWVRDASPRGKKRGRSKPQMISHCQWANRKKDGWREMAVLWRTSGDMRVTWTPQSGSSSQGSSLEHDRTRSYCWLQELKKDSWHWRQQVSLSIRPHPDQ